MRVNGSKTSRMEWERKFGQITPFTKVITTMERSMVKGSLTGRTEVLSLENLRTTTSMDKEFTRGPMDVDILEPGFSTRCTATEFSLGRTAANTKENTSTTRRQAMESSCGPMVVNTMASGATESSMARAPTSRAKERLKSATGKKESA